MNFVAFVISTIFSLFLVQNYALSDRPDKPWGFYGHRKINRMAVYTLPAEMLAFYKDHIEFITEHSIDPDKRRYATVNEAVRHYMDIDHWGQYPFDNVPRDLTQAIIRYSNMYLVNASDTLGKINLHSENFWQDKVLIEGSECGINPESIKLIFRDSIMPQYPRSKWMVNLPGMGLNWIGQCPEEYRAANLLVIDRFSEHGILPYHLKSMYYQLSNAFFNRNTKRILRLSAEMGHYVSDAHVPLHTTKNYNGQLTDQLGIHAFWETRIPELFADTEYDFFVGKPGYIGNPGEYFWNIVTDSHLLLDSVLNIEKRLSREFPSDNQYCFEDRLNRTVRVPCYEYALAYQNAMNGMVEKRMRDAIHSVASVWYSAWVDAGQPDLKFLLEEVKWSEEEVEASQVLDELSNSGKSLGRKHND